MTVIEWLLSDCCAGRAALGKKCVSLLRSAELSSWGQGQTRWPSSSSQPLHIAGERLPIRAWWGPGPSQTLCFPLLLYFLYPVQVWKHTHKKKNPARLFNFLDFNARKGFSSCTRDEQGGTACGWPQYITKWIMHLFDVHVSEKKKKPKANTILFGLWSHCLSQKPQRRDGAAPRVTSFSPSRLNANTKEKKCCRQHL